MQNYDKNLMDWNDSIESDGKEFVLLPEGDYNFTVTNFERGRFTGGAKVPPCNKATITVQVKTNDGISTVRFDLLLYRSLEWRISSFFRCIGQKKHGEKLVMDWNKVVGSRGRGHFKIRTYMNSNNEEKSVNDLDKFYDYDSKYFDGIPSGMVEVSDEEIPF